jgi:Cu-Zn family superoxide dismutase
MRTGIREDAMQRLALIRVGVVAGLVLGGPAAAAAQHAGHGAAEGRRAVAVLVPTAGNATRGTVTFEAVAGGVRITTRLEGLPAGDHGFHIHELGDCSAADGTSAGGHYNPGGAPHAGPDGSPRHVGDLGNITADTQGMATSDRTDRMVRLDGPDAVLGRAVIVHAAADDLATQPTGNAGARLACGVIGIAK